MHEQFFSPEAIDQEEMNLQHFVIKFKKWWSKRNQVKILSMLYTDSICPQEVYRGQKVWLEDHDTAH